MGLLKSNPLQNKMATKIISKHCECCEGRGFISVEIPVPDVPEKDKPLFVYSDIPKVCMDDLAKAGVKTFLADGRISSVGWKCMYAWISLNIEQHPKECEKLILLFFDAKDKEFLPVGILKELKEIKKTLRGKK